MTFQRLFRSLLCVATVITIIQISIFHANAESAEIAIDYPESVGIGRSFEVNLSLNNPIDVSAIMLAVDYDANFLSLKDVLSNAGGEVDYYVEKDTANIIYLSRNSIESGDFLTLQFTAKTGNESSIQEIRFTCLQAVNSKLEVVNISLNDSINVEIIKANNSQNIESSRRSTQAEKSNSSKSKSVSSKTTSDKKSNSASPNNERIFPKTKSSYTYSETELINSEYEDTSSMEFVSNSDSKMKYVLAGAGLASGYFIIVFAAYRSGQASVEKTSTTNKNDDSNGEKETDKDKNKNTTANDK